MNAGTDTQFPLLTVKGLVQSSKGTPETEQGLYEILATRATSQPCIPTGFSAGAPGPLYPDVIQDQNGIQKAFHSLFNKLGTELSQRVADRIWAGKIFANNDGREGRDCTTGRGVNRIVGLKLITLTNRLLTAEEYLDEADWFKNPDEELFRAALTRRLETGRAVNLVELNYSSPTLDPLGAGRKFGVRDVMVPVVQFDGSVIYVGRAYNGVWESGNSFRSTGNLAWFFLDFTDRGLGLEPFLQKCNRALLTLSARLCKRPLAPERPE